MTDNSNTAQGNIDNVPASVIERIQKILALAESATNTSAEHRQAEAANALAMAQKLLQQYNLDISTIQGHKVQDDSLGAVKDMSFAMPSKKLTRYGPNRTRADQPWIQLIADAVARGALCKAMMAKYTVYFIGRTRNVEASMYMFENILNQVQDFARVATKENNARLKLAGAGDLHYVEGDNNPIVFRNSWLLGAASTIQKRLAQQRSEFEKQTATRTSSDGATVTRTGMEVVLASDTEVDDYIDEKWNNGRARKAREWRADFAKRQAAREQYAREHPEEQEQASTSMSRGIITDTRTDKQRERDAARARKEHEHAEEKERNYYRRYGHHSWEQAPAKERQLNRSAYYKGIDDGHRVSLDAGKVSDAERKRLGGK